jgi:hypothetical protein
MGYLSAGWMCVTFASEVETSCAVQAALKLLRGQPMQFIGVIKAIGHLAAIVLVAGVTHQQGISD